MTQKHSSEFLLIASGIQHRVPRRTLSPHPAFRDTATLLQEGRPDEMSFLSQGRTKIPPYAALDISAISLFGSNGGYSFHHTARYIVASPWRTFTLSVRLPDSIWLLCRLRRPARTLAFSRPWNYLPSGEAV